MGTYQLTSQLKGIVGVRMERTDMFAQSGRYELLTSDEDKADERGDIEKTDFLPSINLIYALTDKMNLRGSYTQTLARPNMREMAPFASFDFIGGAIANGNADLKRTSIQNYDLRWELFPKPGDLVALSAYFKQFKDPIIVQNEIQAGNPQTSWQNVDQAFVYGAEFEFRKDLAFISPVFAPFKFGTNISYIYSRVDMDSLEFQSARTFNKEITDDWRPFVGQSPFLVNANLDYNNREIGLETTLSYNVFGRRLAAASQFGVPDIYEIPRHTLNLVIKKKLTENIRINLALNNLLNATYEKNMRYNGQDYLYNSYQLGRTYSFSVNYSIK